MSSAPRTLAEAVRIAAEEARIVEIAAEQEAADAQFTTFTKNLKDMKKLGRRLKGRIPAGPSGKGGVELTSTQMESILSEGAKAAVELGLGHEGDLDSMESNGFFVLFFTGIS